MPELELVHVFGDAARGLLPSDLYDRFGPTLEVLRRSLLAEASREGHPLFHLPPDGETVLEVRSAARSLRREAEILVVAGIGGSSLGAKVLCGAAADSRVRFLEGVDPEVLQSSMANIPWDRAALNIVSKSGNTLETLVNAGLCLEALKQAHPEHWRQRVVVTASPGDGRLQQWAAREKIHTLTIAPPVGGRFSVLTPVGLLPATFEGMDPTALVAGAKAGADKSLLTSGKGNPALTIAMLLFGFFSAGKSEVALWGYGSRCHLLARWIRQLWGESLGRRIGSADMERRIGPTPLACRGSEDQHSLLQLFMEGPQNRWILFLTSEGQGPNLPTEVREFAGVPDRVSAVETVQRALWSGTRRALQEAGVPIAHYDLGVPTTSALGESFYVFQAATMYAAKLFEVDPFGQPGVEAGKRYTRDFLSGVTESQ